MGNPVPIYAANAEAIVLCGPSLAGKSTACLRIAAELHAAVISADAINAARGLVLVPSRAELLARHAQLSRGGGRPLLSLPGLLEHLDSFEWPTPDEGAVDITTAERLETWLRIRSFDGPGRN